MSIATITTLGYGSFGSVNSAVVFGYSPGSAPPVVITPVTGGAADKKKRDREEYFRKRRARKVKEAREDYRPVQTRAEPVNVIEHQPQTIDLRPNLQEFKAVAGPQKFALPAPPPEEELPLPKVFRDDEDIFMLTE